MLAVSVACALTRCVFLSKTPNVDIAHTKRWKGTLKIRLAFVSFVSNEALWLSN